MGVSRPSNESTKPGIVPSQAPAPIRPRQRALKLAEITKPLTPELNDSMARSAFQRVLKAERIAMLGGVAATRQKILASLATLFSGDFKNRMLFTLLIICFIIFLNAFCFHLQLWWNTSSPILALASNSLSHGFTKNTRW